MKIYCEKKFLDDFSALLESDDISMGALVLKRIFQEYGDLSIIIDQPFDSPEELDKLKAQSLVLSMVATGEVGLHSIEKIDDVYEEQNLEQTIVLTSEKKDWFEEVHHRGALCMTLANFEETIEGVLNSCHLKIDLSRRWQGWNILDCLQKLPCRYLAINDSYILKESTNRNLIQILKTLIHENNKGAIVQIFTSDLKSRGDFSEVQLKPAYNDILGSLQDRQIDLTIFKNDFHGANFRLHDRIIFSDFYSVDSGVGFNIPRNEESNSQVVIETIFDKYTFERINRLKQKLKDHRNAVRKLASKNILYYPN